jgi:hypothetical protein
MSTAGGPTITNAATRRCLSATRRHRAARHSASSIHISRARKSPRAIGGIAAASTKAVHWRRQPAPAPRAGAVLDHPNEKPGNRPGPIARECSGDKTQGLKLSRTRLSTPGNYGAACGLLRAKTNNTRGNADRTPCGYAVEKQGLRTRVRWFCSAFVHPLRPTANPTRKPVPTLSSPQTTTRLR